MKIRSIIQRLAAFVALLLGMLAWGVASAADKPVNVLMIGHGNPRGFEPWWPKFQAACARDGVNVQILVEDGRQGLGYDFYTSDVLKKFHVVVYSGMLEDTTRSDQGEKAVAGFRERLDAFYKAGGGVLWAPMAFGHWGTLWNKSTGDRYDARSLEEDIYDPPKTVDINPTFNNRLYRYIWTSNVTKHPVTEGVRGLLLPTTGEWSWPGTVPFKFGKSWTPLIRGMDSTITIGNAAPPGSGRAEFKPEIKGTYSSAPEIIGVRDSVNGSGRMMTYPFHATHTWKNFNHFAFNDAMMLKGDGTHFSDGMRLFLNGCKWLAKPAVNAGLVTANYQPPAKPALDLAPVDWSKTRFPEGSWKSWQNFKSTEFRGLIGARTAASDGQGTVADYATEAKKHGLSFIVFLENLEKVDDARFANLVKDCKAQSNDSFVAVPGYLYRDLVGNQHFAFDVEKLPLPDNMTPERKVIAPVNIVDQNAWANGQGIAELGKMKLNLSYLFVFTCAAPYVYDCDKLVDDGFTQYCRSEGLGHQYPPVSLTVVRSPDDLGRAVGAAHISVYMGKQLGDFLGAIKRQGERPSIYITNGPKIDCWSDLHGASSPYRPGGERFRVELRASSPEGLREVLIVNAKTGKPYRRYMPQGAKEFACSVDESHKDQWYLIPVITDMNGRTAVGPTVFTYQVGNQFHMMGDRLMGMHHCRVWDEQHKSLQTMGGWIGHPWTKPYWGGGSYPYNSREEELKIQGIDGGAIHSSSMEISPEVVTDAGSEPKVPAFRFQNKLASFDYAVMDYVGDAQFLENKRNTKKNPGWWPTPDPQVPNQIADITARTWAVRPRYHTAVAANVHEITVTFKRDAKLDRVKLGGMHSGGENIIPYVMLKDREGEYSWLINPGEAFRRRGVMDAGGYLFPANFRGGAVGIVNLGPEPIDYDCSGSYSELNFAGGGRQVKAGDQIKVRFLTFMHPWQDQDNSHWLKQFIADFGIGCKPGYRYDIKQGKLRDVDYAMDLDPVDGGAALEVKKYNLPHNLLVRLNGLPEGAIAGRYDLDRKQLLILPVFEGTATTSVNTTRGDNRLYIGELFHCEGDEVLLSAVQDGADKMLLEIHNPTDTPKTVKLTAVPGFTPLSALNETVKVAPFSSEKRTYPVAKGLLDYTPYQGD